MYLWAVLNGSQGPDGHPGEVGDRGSAGESGEKVRSFHHLLLKNNSLAAHFNGLIISRVILDDLENLVPLAHLERPDQR